MFVPPKKLNFRMSIPSDFQDDWDFFNERAKKEGLNPSELLIDIIQEYLEGYNLERIKTRDEIMMEEEEEVEEITPKKVKVKKVSPPPRKSFVSKRAKVTVKREAPESNEAVDITGTPKFRFLELTKSLDKEEGINPDDLIQKAEEIGIPNPRLQMNKMIRRGILYVHQGNVHVT